MTKILHFIKFDLACVTNFSKNLFNLKLDQNYIKDKNY